ncbi:hypothetical protein XL92_004674 [Salmonella enterica subsp. enterica]|nr:hypothetical protein [Salmonella enterica subsp. enterica]
METRTMNDILFLNKKGNRIPVGICNASVLHCSIFWSFTTLALADSLDADDLQYSLSKEYIGSNHYMSDEGYVFDCQSRKLTGLFLNVPDENFDGAHFLLACLDSNIIEGIPYALSNDKFSAIGVADYRYLSDNADYLLCVSRDCLDYHSHDILRVRVHGRLELLFLDKEHCGFILKDPIRSLVRFVDFDIAQNKNNADSSIDTSSCKDLFILYFNTMDVNGWNGIDDKKVYIKKALDFIVNKLKNADLSKEPFFALKEQCERLLHDYYE